MTHPWLFGAAVAYASFGMLVCIIGIGDYFEQQDHDGERWWHLPRALAFCLFVSQWVIAWFILKECGSYGRRLLRKVLKQKEKS